MMINDFFKILEKVQKEYGNKTILLMQVGGFYEAYSTLTEGYNLKELSTVMNIQYTKKNKNIKTIDRSNPYMLGFPIHCLKKYIKILIENQYTVVVYYQVEVKSKIERKQLGIFTYGTYIDDLENPMDACNKNSLELTNTTENNIICIFYEDKVMNVSRIDITTGNGTIMVNPFIDFQQQILFLYNFIQAYPSREIVYYNNDNSFKDFENILIDNLDLHESKIMLYKFKFGEHSNINYQREFLERIYGKEILLSHIEKIGIEKYPNLVVSWIMLIDYAYQHNPVIVKNIPYPELYTEHNHLTLANNAIEQLNLLSKSCREYNNKYQSVYHIINNCCTNMGKRFLKQELLRPLSIPKLIEERYLASELLQESYLKVEDILNGFCDLERLQRRFNLGLITPFELQNLYESYKKIKDLEQINEWNKIPFINAIPSLDFINEMEKYYCFDKFNENEYFNKNISEDIDKLKQLIQTDMTCIENLHQTLNYIVIKDEKRDIQGVKLENSDKDGYYFTVSLKRSYAIKSELGKENSSIKLTDLVFKQLPKSAVVKIYYNNPIFINIRENTNELKELIKVEWINTCEKLSNKYKFEMNNIISWICRLDFILSNIKTAKMYNYCKPQIMKSTKSFLKTKGIRHPLVERLIENKFPYVSHNINLGTGKQDGMLLYGLNSSGKSSLMKAIGINIIMAQCGLYVPASSFVYYPYKTIFTRISGNDNIYKGLSSFTLEMYEINNIIKRSDKNCLIIGDEICRGTETISACSIVSALLIILSKRESSFIFASHLHDLYEISDIKNLTNLKVFHLKVTIDNEGILNYERELIPGVGDNLYGVKVAKSIISDNEFCMLTEKMKEIHIQLYNQGHKRGDEISLQIISDKKSKYNASKFVTNCEICGKKASYKGELETHHVIPQEECSEDGFINNKKHLKKNSKWNLQVLCNDCHEIHHQLEHDRNKTIIKWKETMSFIEISNKLKDFGIKLSVTTIKKL